jgi:XTP/dITP diphosphohydrolase
LLSWPAWQRLHEADEVLAGELDEDWADQLEAAGVEVADLAGLPVPQRAGRLLEAAGGGRTVVWLGSPDGDPGLTDALADHLSRRAVAGRPPEVELVTGSYDLAGARLLDLVAVMDRLRSPGGCPWDAEQTHASLLPYLLEETHEVIEAVERGDRDHLREELGDLLLQVVFHARVAAEHERAPFDVDDVAAGIVEKLVRRHPHVFADAEVGSAAEVEQSWEQLKAAEKGRTGVFEGIPTTLPALARAQKMAGRLAGRDEGGADRALAQAAGADELAGRLLELVGRARAEGVDAEASLRAALTRLADLHR